MKSIRSVIVVAGTAAAVLLGAGPAAAQQGQMPKSEQTKKAERPSPEKIERKERQVKGKVLSTKQVEVKRTGTKNLVALVQPKKGDDRIVVDLGPAQALGKANVKRGATIDLQGRMIMVGDRPVLVATKVRNAKTTVDIKREAQEKQARSEVPGQKKQEGTAEPPSGKAKAAPVQKPPPEE